MAAVDASTDGGAAATVGAPAVPPIAVLPSFSATPDVHGGKSVVATLPGTMVLFQGLEGVTSMKDAIAEEDIIDIDLGEDEVLIKSKWLVIGKYYSGKHYNVRGMFKELSVPWGSSVPAPVRELGENTFLIELDSKNSYDRVVHGGPWKHKGDALLIREYDGLPRFFLKYT
ncbi:hypothetical protein ACP4OV_026908 [Aristida adscensionis]